MPRRRSQQTVTFVLDDSPEGHALDVPDGHGSRDPAGGQGGPARKAGSPQARRRRAALVVGVAALGVALAVVLVNRPPTQDDTHEAIERTDAGVLDLSRAPRDLWSVPTDGGTPFVVDDLLVLPGRSGLAGFDVGTGTQRWRLDELAGQVCTASPEASAGRTDPAGPAAGDESARSVVCLETAADRVTAQLVSLDGSVVAGVVLDPAAGTPTVGVGGVILQATRDAAGAVVRATDLRTGEAAWEQRLTVRETGAEWTCGTSYGEALRIDVRSGVAGVYGCGLLSFVTAGGLVLDEPVALTTVAALGDGTFLRSSGTALAGPVDAVAADGTVRWTSEGLVLEGGVSDRTASDLVLLDQGEALLALHPDGATAWTAQVAARQVLVRTADVVLVQTVDRETVALDPATGAERWRRAVGPLSDAVPQLVGGTAADRATAVLVGPAASAGYTVVALDLASGDVRWTQEHVGDPEVFQASQGRLRSDRSAVTGLG